MKIKHPTILMPALLSSALYIVTTNAYAIPCPFNPNLTCTLFHDILNDVDGAGLRYYGPTNYDHRFSGEIEVFNANLVQPYTDATNAPGQIKLTAQLVNGAWQSGEIMTRPDLEKPPYNAPKQIHPFATSDIQHGYVEVKLKTPRCETSDDGLCQNGTNPQEYSRGLWPSFWMLPNHDTDWPMNGEIDIWEAYQTSQPLNVSTSALHFNGNDPRCGGNDCKFIGFNLQGGVSNNGPLYNDFHTWGFEWQPDPNSTDGGVIMTEYFDNAKIWGPLTSDSLPADGPKAFSRGFHDPNGGFYLIGAVAVGGGYAGNPNPHMRSATMYVQSVKTYSVGGGGGQQGTVTLNFAAGNPSQCMGISDTLNIGANDHPTFTVSNNPFNYTMQIGGPFTVSLKSTGTPVSVAGGTCSGSLNSGQVSVPGQLTATYTFTPSQVDTGTIKVALSAQSDTKCNTATDTFFLDQNPGVNFTVGNGITQTVNTGAHQIKLDSFTSIPAGTGFCSSTVDNANVTVQKNQVSTVTATYKFQDNTGMSCAVAGSSITGQADWGPQGIVNTFQVTVNLKGFPADSSGKIAVNGTLTMKNNFVQNFWGNFGMTSSTNQNVGTFNGNAWQTQLVFGGFINNKNPMHIGDDPLQGMVIGGVTCR